MYYLAFIDYTSDRDFGDKTVALTEDEFKELEPHSMDLVNRTWGPCSKILGKCLSRNEVPITRGGRVIEVAIC